MMAPRVTDTALVGLTTSAVSGSVQHCFPPNKRTTQREEHFVDEFRSLRCTIEKRRSVVMTKRVFLRVARYYLCKVAADVIDARCTAAIFDDGGIIARRVELSLYTAAAIHCSINILLETGRL